MATYKHEEEYHDLVYKAVLSQGSDYDIAHLFLKLYPNCKDYTDKQISTILSNQLHTCFHTAAQKYHVKLAGIISREEGENIGKLHRACFEVMNFLKSHHHKKSYIAEIKMLR